MTSYFRRSDAAGRSLTASHERRSRHWRATPERQTVHDGHDREGRRPMNHCKIWIEQCEAARGIEDEFGTAHALKYLVGEKFMNYLQAAETDAGFRAELPAFVAEIKSIFEPWQLAEYLEKAGWTEPFDPTIFEEEGDDPEVVEAERQDNLRRVANELLLIERAKGWLLEGSDT